MRTSLTGQSSMSNEAVIFRPFEGRTPASSVAVTCTTFKSEWFTGADALEAAVTIASEGNRIELRVHKSGITTVYCKKTCKSLFINKTRIQYSCSTHATRTMRVSQFVDLFVRAASVFHSSHRAIGTQWESARIHIILYVLLYSLLYCTVRFLSFS